MPEVQLSPEESKVLLVALVVTVVLAGLYSVWVWIAEHVLATAAIVGLLIVAGYLLVRNVDLKKLFSQLTTGNYIDDEEVRRLVENIRQIKVQDVRNEEDFEKQLYQRLDAKGYPVRRQVKVGPKNRIDMVVGSVGIELKLADKAQKIQNLIGQVAVYEEHFRKLIVVILDPGNAQIRKHADRIRKVNPEKITVVFVEGKIKRYKTKEDYILVKRSRRKV